MNLFFQTAPVAQAAQQASPAAPAEIPPHITIDPSHSLWLPKQNSTLADSVDWSWDIVMIVSVAFFMLLMGLMVYFAIRYKRRSEFDITSDRDHNARLEWTWTMIPLAIVIALFFVGFKGYLYASVPPAEAMEINVTAQKWAWSFTYPQGIVTNELTVPAGRPVKLIMSSTDVLHSFYVPEFRVKRDVIPGMYTTLWFQAKEPAQSTLFCTEYCGGGGDGQQGSGHSAMWTRVHVVTEPDFDKWVLSQTDDPNAPPAEKGQKLYATRACAGCHTLDGARANGPTFKGLFGHDVPLASGKTVKADENYLRESILYSQKEIVAGYGAIMPSFEGQLSDKEVTYLIEFIKTVK